LRAIQNERVFLQLERAKVEQGKLYRAAQALGAALSEKDVVEAGVKAAREIASFDLAAVTVFEPEARFHEVVAARSSDGEIDDLVGVRFSHNAGLVSMVVQNRCPLPYRGEYETDGNSPAWPGRGRRLNVVLSKRLPWPAHPSLLVLPLVIHERALGTLILGAKRRHAFGDSVRPTLEVLASHLAVSLSNARMVHKLETMATTDGLTGLFNKRAMLECATQKIAAAARFDRKLAVLIADIDHFKKVNDTYGHLVGDTVLKEVGRRLAEGVRTYDSVGRYGGEEFLVIVPGCKPADLAASAERLRRSIAEPRFETSAGPLAVTLSIGIASGCDDGESQDSEQLLRAADTALYRAKAEGRNRVGVAPVTRAVAQGS
jgi:diguanylate cyclase (GGDEF)-like protein